MFGDRLKKARQHCGYTQEELARLSGTTKNYVWELENKETVNPKADLVARLAKALDVTADFLMGTTDEVNKESIFFRDYSKLSDNNKKQVARFMKMLKEDADGGDEL